MEPAVNIPMDQEIETAMPWPAYKQIGPDICQHTVSGEIVVGREILAFAETHPESELHSVFEWSDEKVACLWRLQQVRELLLNELIIRPDGEPDIKEVKSLGSF